MVLTEFFPTPRPLIDKMLSGIDFKLIATVLEPSAGKGDIAIAVNDKMRYAYSNYGREFRGDIDCIEVDANLRHILNGNNYRVVHDDFLTYHSRKQYDLIIMNPPFSDGEKHLTKALELQEHGGHVVCLLNAETLRNPYTNVRKALVRRLKELDADIEYLTGAFESAERTTSVEVALVKVCIPRNMTDSLIISGLKRAQDTQRRVSDEPTAIAHSQFVEAIVERYRFEVDAGVQMIREWVALQPYIKDSITKEDKYQNPILELKFHCDDHERHGLLNGYIRAVRLKYWGALFSSPEFIRKLPSNLQTELYNRVNELADYEFSIRNILDIQLQMSQQTVQSIEDTILALFDELSGKHAYSEDLDNGNVHYFDGWKTNKAWKINRKVILPFYGAMDIWLSKWHFNYKFKEKIHDIMTVLDFLSADLKYTGNASDRLKRASDAGRNRNISLGHISISVYKKGTVHITFEDEHLLEKFNLFGSQRRGWLPPSYGKRAYKDMSDEERAVINSYEGEAAYAKLMENPEAYIVEPSGLLQLTATVST